VSNNQSNTYGGGISNWGKLQIIRSEIRNNSLPTILGGGGVTSQGGGIFNSGELEIACSAVTENVASRPEQSVTGETAPVPDPFLAYAKGENVLRQQLAEVPSSLLRAMIIAYDFALPSDRDLQALKHVELIELIVGAIRTRFAA